MDRRDPKQLLAQRLRSLREEYRPERRITQQQLAEAMGVSIPAISSWESHSNPRLPPLSRLEAYARLFASLGSFDSRSANGGDAVSAEVEPQAENELKRELIQLRNAVMQAGLEAVAPGQRVEASVSSGPWYFPGRGRVSIVCAQLPKYLLDRIPYTNVDDPDYVELLTFSELDSLFELYGHIRAANPDKSVLHRTSRTLGPDDYQSHLVVLGGVDWNELTKTTLDILRLPVRQVADWTVAGGQYFEVDENGSKSQHKPVLTQLGELQVLHEDVALFVRAINPFNRALTVTICTGMYGRGTYGVVRALTDANFRDRNAAYLDSRFGECEVYCVLTRVPVIHGATLTPDWATGDQTLFEWSR